MVLKTTIEPDVLPKLSTYKFVMQQNLNDDNNNSNNETSNTSASHPSKTSDSSGRSVKSRVFMIYTGKSCSRSCTPSDWRSAVKGRKHRHTDKEKHDDHNKEDPHSRRHERPRNDHHRRRHSSSPTNDSPTRHDRRPKTSPPSSSQIRSPSPPIDDQSGIDHSQSHQKEYVNTICANPASSSSKKRRKRWENEEELNRPERTSHTFVKTEISSSSIDQQQDQTSSSYNQREELKHDRKRVNHTLAEWQVFEQVHRCQLNHYIQDSILVSLLIYKFFLGST